MLDPTALDTYSKPVFFFWLNGKVEVRKCMTYYTSRQSMLIDW